MIATGPSRNPGRHSNAAADRDIGTEVGGGIGADLADSREPADLVPGSPARLRAAAAALTEHGATLDGVGRRMRTLDDGGWTGAAADAFRAHTRAYARRCFAAGDAAREVAAALTTHADLISWAREQAADAARSYTDADDLDAHRADTRNADVDDQVATHRARAREILDRARRQLADLGNATRDTVDHATATLPPAPRALTHPDQPPLATTNPIPASPGQQRSEPEAHPGPPGTRWSLPTTPTDPIMARPGTRSYTVQPGDTLGAIADTHLHDTRRWPELFDANRGHAQPDGGSLTFPWLLRPGWQLDLPPDTTSPPGEHPTGAGQEPGPLPHAGPDHPTDRPAPPPGGASDERPPPASPAPHLAPPSTPVPNPAVPEPAPLPTPPPVSEWRPLPDPTTPQPPPATPPPAHPPSDVVPQPPPTQPPWAPLPAAPQLPPPAEIDRPPENHGADHNPSEDDGVDLGTGMYIGIGVAAALTAALILSRNRPRLHGRATATAGAAALAADTPPIVRRLHTAYQDRAATPSRHPQSTLLPSPSFPVPAPPSQGSSSSRPPAPSIASRQPPMRPPAPPARSQPARQRAEMLVPIGTHAGHRLDLDLAAPGATALSGPGMLGVTRALLVALLTSGPAPAVPGVTVALAADDARALLGDHHDPTPHPGISVHADLLTCLDTIIRARLDNPARSVSLPARPTVLITSPGRPDRETTRRLHRVINTGPAHQVYVLILHTGNVANTVYIDHNGYVDIATGPAAQHLRDARLFTLQQAPTIDLLRALNPAPWPTEPAPTPPNTAAAAPRAHPAGPARADQPSPPPDARPEGTVPTGHPAARPEQPSLPPDGRSTGPLAAAGAGHPVESARAAGDSTDEPEPSTPEPSGAAASTENRILINVLGPPRLRWTRGPGTHDCDITAEVSDRKRELIAYLALHRDGARRDTIIDALWADTPPQRPANVFNTAMTRLRQTIDAATAGAITDLVTITGDGRYRLHPDRAAVDLWDFTDALTARRATTTAADRADADRRILAHYRGEFADGITAEWAHAPRENTLRDAIDAAEDLADYLTADDPEQALGILEHATTLDPHNETLYRHIMRLHHRLGRPAAARRTLAALTARLAELGAQPHPTTMALAHGRSLDNPRHISTAG